LFTLLCWKLGRFETQTSSHPIFQPYSFASLFASTGSPHAEQNLSSEVIDFPHCGQETPTGCPHAEQKQSSADNFLPHWLHLRASTTDSASRRARISFSMASSSVSCDWINWAA
jgi:hypothetical protein